MPLAGSKRGLPLIAAIDDRADPIDGETRFRDRRGEHDFAPPRRRRPDRCILRFRRHRAIKRHDVGITPAALPRRAALRCAGFRLRPAGKRARFPSCSRKRSRRSSAPSVRPVPLQSAARHRRVVTGKTRPGACNHRRAIEESRKPLRIERRRHHENFEIRPQAVARIERQGQGEIAIKRALMELIEDDDRRHRSKPGSACNRRVSKPSVTTSMRVFSEILRSCLTA